MEEFQGITDMVIEIEYFKGDTLLYGKNISFGEFRRQMKTIENLYDPTEDNFLALLCRLYHWNVLEGQEEPQYVYDRDIKKCFRKSIETGIYEGG